MHLGDRIVLKLPFNIEGVSVLLLGLMSGYETEQPSRKGLV